MFIRSKFTSASSTNIGRHSMSPTSSSSSLTLVLTPGGWRAHYPSSGLGVRCCLSVRALPDSYPPGPPADRACLACVSRCL